MSRVDRLLLGFILVAIVLGLGLGSAFDLRLLTQAGLYAMMALGYRQLFGGLGVLSLAQGAFFGVGAYAAAIALADANWPLPLAVAVAALAPALLALPMGLALLRLGSHYFALASLGLAQLLFLLALNWQSLTGGANGKGGVTQAAFGQPSAPLLEMAMAVWIGVALVTAALMWRQGGLAALRQEMMREAAATAASIGLDGGTARLKAFVLSGAIAGLAGAGHAMLSGVVAPDVMELGPMVLCLSIVVIGGRFSNPGVIAAALLLVHLPEWLRWAGPWYLVANAGILVGALIAAPDGLAGLLARLLPAAHPPLPLPAQIEIAPAAPFALGVRGVTKNFGGVRALDDVSLELSGGEIAGLIGANGAGKTTLINLVGGQLRADGGAVRLDAADLSLLAPPERARLGIARIFQTVQLPINLRAIDAVAVADSGDDIGQARARALGWMARLAIADWADRPVGEMPAALRRRLDLARALMQSPRLLLLDEPVGGLGAEERLAIGDILRTLRGHGLAIFIVEHETDWLMALCDRLYCLDRGRIVAAGPPDELRGRADLAGFFPGQDASVNR